MLLQDSTVQKADLEPMSDKFNPDRRIKILTVVGARPNYMPETRRMRSPLPCFGQEHYAIVTAPVSVLILQKTQKNQEAG